jgi:hypothetical protein
MGTTYKVGGECDAWCTKCKRDTLHNIIALAAGNLIPARVECRSCHGVHNYAAPKSTPRPKAERSKVSAAPREKAPSAGTPTKAPKPSPAATAKAATAARENELRWEGFVVRNAAVPEQAYSARSVFAPGDTIRHTNFGLGFVVEKTGDQRIKVLFRDAERTLVTGYGA